jgi:polar amino acid transport system permease protein
LGFIDSIRGFVLLFIIISLQVYQKNYASLFWVIRGTPLMLQIIVVFYVPGLLFNIPSTSRMIAVIVALVINYSVYFSEIFRSGYQSINKGQREASLVLGLNKREMFFNVLLIQIIKRVIPPITNETISLVKDTALARVIAINEVIMTAQNIVSTYAIIWVLFYTGVFYLVFNGVLSLLLKGLEKKLQYFEA